MYLFKGDFKKLKELGFIQNLDKTFWFYPNMGNGHSLIVEVADKSIEFSADEDLTIIKGLYERILV